VTERPDRILPAAEFIPYGAPACPLGGGCGVATAPADMIGVARRRGAGEHGYAIGENVHITTDGGILMVPPFTCDVMVRGKGFPRRLVAREHAYVELLDGKIVG
jgi:hypothetical protein